MINILQPLFLRILLLMLVDECLPYNSTRFKNMSSRDFKPQRDNREMAVAMARSSEYRKLYLNCGAEHGCVGISWDTKCLQRKNCAQLLTYQMNLIDGMLEFAMIASDQDPGDHFIAVGFGDHPLMINNSVVGCFIYRQKKNIHFSFNNQQLRNNPNISQKPLVKGKLFYDAIARKIFCSFKLKLAFEINSVPFNLNSDPVYLLFAKGNAKSITQMEYHKPWGAVASTSKVNLLATTFEQHVFPPSNTNTINSVRVHVCFSVFVFIFLVPTSGMIARFFKESCIDRRICNKRLWFVIHWVSSLTALVMIIGGSVLVELTNGGFRIKTNTAYFHYGFGIAVAAFTGIVAALGLLIGCVNPVSCLRHLFSFLHCILGNFVYLVGLVQLFLSVWSMPYYMKFCSYQEVVILCWMIFHGFIYMILSVILHRRDIVDAKILQLRQFQGLMRRDIKHNEQAGLEVPQAPVHRVHDFAAAGLKSPSVVTFKTDEEKLKVSKLIDDINYNRLIMEKLHKLNDKVYENIDDIRHRRLTLIEGESKNKDMPNKKTHGRRSLTKVTPDTSHDVQDNGKIQVHDKQSGSDKDVHNGHRKHSHRHGHHHSGSGPTDGEDAERESQGNGREGQSPSPPRIHRRRFSQPVPNTEDPQDFLNYFHENRQDLDQYRAFRQFPLQPQLNEYAHTKLAAFLLMVFALTSCGTALSISYLMYADNSHAGCSLDERLLLFQQW